MDDKAIQDNWHQLVNQPIDRNAAPPIAGIQPALWRAYWNAVDRVRRMPHAAQMVSLRMVGVFVIFAVFPAMNDQLQKAYLGVVKLPRIDPQEGATHTWEALADSDRRGYCNMLFAASDTADHPAKEQVIPLDQFKKEYKQKNIGSTHGKEALDQEVEQGHLMGVSTRPEAVAFFRELMDHDAPQHTAIRHYAADDDQHQTQSRTSTNKKIWAGKRTWNDTEFPYVVAIGRYPWPGNILWPINLPYREDDQYRLIPKTRCTGTVLSDKWIITSAHCVRTPWDSIYITVGTACRPERGGIWQIGSQTRRVVVSLRPDLLNKVGWSTEKGVPLYNVENWADRDTMSQDITLLMVSPPLEMTRKVPIKPKTNQQQEDFALHLLDNIRPLPLPTPQDCDGENGLSNNAWHGVKKHPDGSRTAITIPGWGSAGYDVPNQRGVSETWLQYFDVPDPQKQINPEQHPSDGDESDHDQDEYDYSGEINFEHKPSPWPRGWTSERRARDRAERREMFQVSKREKRVATNDNAHGGLMSVPISQFKPSPDPKVKPRSKHTEQDNEEKTEAQNAAWAPPKEPEEKKKKILGLFPKKQPKREHPADQLEAKPQAMPRDKPEDLHGKKQPMDEDKFEKWKTSPSIGEGDSGAPWVKRRYPWWDATHQPAGNLPVLLAVTHGGQPPKGFEKHSKRQASNRPYDSVIFMAAKICGSNLEWIHQQSRNEISAFSEWYASLQQNRKDEVTRL